MKNLTFKAAALNDGRPTVNRRSTDGQSQRRYSLTPITKRWRALMMVVFLFTLAIGNVLAQLTPALPATTLTLPNIPTEGWKGTVTPNYYKAAGSNVYVFNPYELYLSVANLTWTTQNSGGNSSATPAAMAPFPASSVFTGYKAATLNNTSKGPYAYRVTNCVAAYVYCKSGSDKKRTITLAAYEVDGDGNVAASAAESSSYEKNSDGVISITLNKDKEYYIKVSQVGSGSGGSSSGNSPFYMIAFQAPYKVTLDPDGGSYPSNTLAGWTYDNVNDKYSKYVAAGSLTLPSAPSKGGYDFTEWQDNKANAYTTSITIDKDTVLTAQWIAAGSAYDVNIASMTNGSVVASPTSQAEDGTVTLTVTPDDGYLLSSLSVVGDVSGDEVTVTANQFTMPAEDVTVNATFSLAPTYTVTLNPAGGTIADATGWTLNAGNYEKEVAEGTVLTLPTFTKTDRAFKTWRKAGPADVASPVTVDGDLSLTAIWTATIEQGIYSWESPDGTPIEVGGTAKFYNGNTDASSTAAPDNRVNYANKPVHGDDVTQYYTLRLDKAVDYSAEHVRISLNSALKEGDKIAITAYYTKDQAKTVAPKIANGSNEVVCSADNLANLYNGGTPVTQTKTLNDKAEGATTLKLTRSATSTTAFITKLQIIREVQVEEGDLLTVTFNYNDGVTPNATIQVASGQAVAQPANPIWAHHRFNEWQLAGSAYDFSSAVTADITLVANWTQLYTVTYAKGEESATGDAPTQDELAAGEEFTVAANPFAYDGHDFSTWNDGSADVAPGTEYTMGAANVTLTAQWITATTKVTVTYKDGETTLGSEEITINTGHPVGYATYQTKNLATFDGWYNDPDLAEGHKIADISLLTASANVNVYGKWNYQYASSINIEQWVLDNGAGKGATTKTSALLAEMGTKNYLSNITWENKNNELDTLDDSKTDGKRNYAYLGLKVKKDASNVRLLLQDGKSLKVKFGNVAATPNIKIGDADATAMTITDGVYSLDAASGDREITISTTSAGAVVIKQIMINEDIAAVTLPWRVTYDANGGTCATAEAIWSGAALILPDVTPADADHTFAGWYDEVSGGSLQGAAGASYTPTDNTTLHAHFAPVEYAVNYAAGDHGSGDMAAANVGWGTEYTAVANGFTPESGYIFAGWAVSGVDGVSSIAAGGSFTMPKNPVTLTALWEDNSKVAVIVETNVKYESLADAVATATDGQTIQLLQNNNVTAQVEVAEKAITLDLAGYKIEYTGTSTLPSGVILVHNGASLTIDDSSDPDAGSIVSGEKAYAAIALTKAGDDAANPATLVVNGGTLTGHYYGITGNGSRNNTDITINGGTITGTVGIAIYHPQVGTLTVNNGSLTGEDAAIEMRAGTLVINDGTFTATATVFSCNPNGSGSTTSGAAIAIAQHTTKKDIEVTINGGTFNGVKALNESNPQVNDPAPQVTMAVTAGTFTGEVSTVDVHEFISGGTYDAPVASENCAPGYVPSAEVAPGVYTVVPKDGVEIIGAVVTGNTDATVTGLYKGTASVKLNNKKIDNGDYYIYVTLKDGYTFEENDVLIVDVDTKSNLDGGTKALEITTGVGNIDGDVWKSIAFDDYTTGENIISLEGIAANQTSIGLKRSANQNAKINGLRVLRPMKPMLTAITIDGRDGVIDEANKTVAVTIPYEADLAALTVVPTIAWNEAAATNSIVVNNGGAWVESPSTNTYKLTDKDGDYTVYTITLTRDVLKHAVKFYDGETLLETLEVEDGTNIAAGDVPADPTKEDYIFQGWAETAGGDVVDVTSFTISAAKNFYAKWVADGAIKLLSGATVNHTNFITGVTADETVEFQGNTVNYAKFSGTVSGVNGVKDLTRVIAYNATTNKTKIQISAHNNSTSGRNILVKGLVEGAAEAVDLATIALGNKEDKVSDWIEFNNAANRTIYIMVSSSAGDVYFTQVKVIESGETPMKQAGEAGYSLNLNKGRFFGTASTDLAFEGLNARLSGDYTALNSGYAKLNSTSMSFTVASAMTLSVTTNNNKTYYVTKGAAGTDNETAKTGVSEFDLTAGTWYITAGSSEVQFTNIAFTAPKCEEPTITPMSNSDLCEGDDFAPLTVSASVSDEGTLHYAWYKEAGADDEAVGTDAASYTPEADGEYYVIVTNRKDGFSDNSATSNTTTVKHFAAAVITTAPLNQRGEVGDVVTLSVVATGKNVSYKWYTCDEDGSNEVALDPAQTGTSINVTITAGLLQWYKVKVTSDCGGAEAKAKVSEFVPTTPANVTTSILWDWTSSAWPASGEVQFTNKTEDGTDLTPAYELLADADAIVPNNAAFRSDMLYGKGQYVWRSNNKFFQGTAIKFNTTVAGKVRVNYRSTGNNKEVQVTIAGTPAGKNKTSNFQWSEYVEVPAGDVEIICLSTDEEKSLTRVQKIEFLALAHQRTSGYAAGDLGTVILEDATIIEGANLYELAGLNENGYLAFDEILSGELEAGKPYLFEVTNPSNISFYKPVGADHSDDEIAHKGMIGTFAGTTLYQGSDNYYYFSGRHIWKVNDFTVAIPIPAHRCYVDMDVLQSAGPAQQQAPGRRRVTLGVQGTQVATGIEDVDASEKPVKLLINGQMYILRGEKLFDATGRLVK